MDDIKTKLRGVFAKNRAEELGRDVWRDFVVPPFFERLDLIEARKPRVIVGGRGCGKTMLLRYLSHDSAFSPDRSLVPADKLQSVGLYWRADTQFANAMAMRDQPDDVWESAFNHLLAIAIGREVLASLQSIAASKSAAISPRDLDELDLSRISALDEALPGSFIALEHALEERWWTLQGWVNDVRKATQPMFLPGRHFILALIRIIQSSLPAITGTVFQAYIDEYENLREYQKKIIHTCMKHSEASDSLIFNLAVKRNTFKNPRTLGPESLANIHDWRYHDLEGYLLEENFQIFAAEILYLHLANADFHDIPIETDQLRDPASVQVRRGEDYTEEVLRQIRQMFPDVSEQDLASSVFEQPSLLKKWRDRVKRALQNRGSKVDPKVFLRRSQPKASVVVPALLYRNSIEPEEVARQLDLLDQGEDNRFTGTPDWIHNNFVGCLLQLYEPYARACPFYAGFNTFCEIAHGNIRHLLELCHKSVQQALREESSEPTRISPNQEATAARLASAAFLGEVPSFGRFGNQLHTFVLRLGSLFAIAHQRPSQSEPEITHFAVGRGRRELSDDDHSFLAEAVKWSVLFGERRTKQKQEYDPEGLEYVLNPIYAPYFHISYRKRRSLTLKSDDLATLISGNYESVSSLLRRYSRRWQVDLEEQPPLFSHLQDIASDD